MELQSVKASHNQHSSNNKPAPLHEFNPEMSSTRKSTSVSHTRGKRADPYARPTTTKTATSTTTKPTGLQRQVSFGVGNTMIRVADLKENHDRVVAMGGTARLTRAQALKLEQYTTVQTRSRSRQLADH